MNGNIPEDDWLGRVEGLSDDNTEAPETGKHRIHLPKIPKPVDSQSPRRMNRRNPDSRRNPTASLRFPRNPSLKKSPSYTAPRVK